MSKGSLLLEAYCLEIQLCSATHDTARMRRVYPHTLNMNDVVADPRIMGLIREEGGKMYMSEGQWIDAYNELYEAFRNYQVG
jgi:COP9 signalosome complex subunit 2